MVFPSYFVSCPDTSGDPQLWECTHGHGTRLIRGPDRTSSEVTQVCFPSRRFDKSHISFREVNSPTWHWAERVRKGQRREECRDNKVKGHPFGDAPALRAEDDLIPVLRSAACSPDTQARWAGPRVTHAQSVRWEVRSLSQGQTSSHTCRGLTDTPRGAARGRGPGSVCRGKHARTRHTNSHTCVDGNRVERWPKYREKSLNPLFKC